MRDLRVEIEGACMCMCANEEKKKRKGERMMKRREDENVLDDALYESRG